MKDLIFGFVLIVLGMAIMVFSGYQSDFRAPLQPLSFSSFLASIAFLSEGVGIGIIVGSAFEDLAL